LPDVMDRFTMLDNLLNEIATKNAA